MRLPTLFIVLCLAVTACSAIPVDPQVAAPPATDFLPDSTTLDPDSPPAEGGLVDLEGETPDSLAFDDAEPAGADDAALAAAVEAGRRYRWTVRATVARDAGVTEFEPLTHGWFEADTENAVMVTSAAQAATLDPPASGETAAAWVDGIGISRGHDLGADSSPRDPATWYASDLGAQGELRLFATIEAADVWRILGRTPTDEPFELEPVEFADRLERMGALGFGDLVAAEVSADSSDLELTVTTIDGIVTRIVARWDEPTAIDLKLDIVMKPTAGLRFPDPRSAQPSVPLVPLPPLPKSATGPAFGAALHVDGTRLAQPFRAALTDDNELVIVTSTSGSAGPADFVSWQLDSAGADLVRFIVLENDVLESAPTSVLHHSTISIDVDGLRRLTASTEAGTADPAASAALDLMVERLLDPSWLGASIIDGPVPWVPETLTVELLDDGPQVEVLDWPFARSIDEMSRVMAAPDGTSRSVICLGIGQVEPVWGLLGSGRDNSSLTFTDGPQTYQARVLLNAPGFRLAADPCVN